MKFLTCCLISGIIKVVYTNSFYIKEINYDTFSIFCFVGIRFFGFPQVEGAAQNLPDTVIQFLVCAVYAAFLPLNGFGHE